MFTQHISSQSTQTGGALRKPAEEKLQVCKQGNFLWAEGLPLSPTSFPSSAGPHGGTWQGNPSLSGPRPLALASDTFSVQGHQPQTPTTRREHTKAGLFSQESKETDQQHRRICPRDSFHSSCRASLALGRVHVVSHSAEALAQAEGGQVDLEQTVSHGIMAYTSALSPTGFPAPASGACRRVGWAHGSESPVMTVAFQVRDVPLCSAQWTQLWEGRAGPGTSQESNSFCLWHG